MDPATRNSADTDTEISGAEELLKRWKTGDTEDASKPSEDTSDDTEEPEDTEEEPEDDEDQSEDDSDEDSDDDDDSGGETKSKPKQKVIIENDADAYVKAKIDGKEIEIKVADLTRLYGQEAALTRKSQETAELRKQSEATLARHQVGLEAMLKRAQDRWEPYSKINWIALTKDPDVSQEELSALHSEAQKVWSDVQFLQQGLDGVLQQKQAQSRQELHRQGQEAWKYLSDPDTGIKGWDDKLYGDLKSFAVNHGLPKDTIESIVDPHVFKLLHKAYLYDKGQKATKETTKVTKTAKKIIKETPEPVTKQVKKGASNKAEDKFRRSGSVDDATELLLSRWSDK
jgi:acyl transferase domain-containing protein